MKNKTTNSDNRWCLYCARTKPAKEFSREHIIPQAIAGNLTPANPFIIGNVCGKCNNLSGLFIDGAFVRSYLTNNNRSLNTGKFVRLSPSTVLPLTYMGQSKDLKRFRRICDFWIGPAGDSIFHFHKPYPSHPNQSPVVGIPPESKIEMNIDHGFVFLYVASNNPLWHPAIINSVISNFDQCKIYLGNGPRPMPRFSNIPCTLRLMNKKIKSGLLTGKFQKTQLTIAVDYGNRFLAKISLGLGSILLNNSFMTSASADLLREFMWTKDYGKRKLIPVRGTGFLGEMPGLAQNNLLKWDGGHVLALINLKNEIVLYSNFYGTQEGLMLVSDYAGHWVDSSIEGLVFVIVPGLGRVVGPLDIAEFIGHKVVPPQPLPELTQLENEMTKFSTLPPFRI